MSHMLGTYLAWENLDFVPQVQVLMIYELSFL